MRRKLLLPCATGPQVADAPPKRKPGRPKKSKSEPSAQPQLAVAAAETTESPPKEKQSRKKKSEESDSDEDEEILPTFPAPWEQLSPQQVEKQNHEYAIFKKQKAIEAESQSQEVEVKWRARDSRSNAFIHRDPAWLELESKLLVETETGCEGHTFCMILVVFLYVTG